MKTSPIDLHSILFDDHRFSLLPDQQQEAAPALLASIQRTGILQPPLLLAHGDSFLIISGRGRLLALRALHKSSCDCRVLPPSTPPLEIFNLLLEEHLFKSSFTIIEQAIFLKKALQWLSKEEVSQRFLPTLGQSPHPSQLEKLLRLAGLEEVIQRAVHLGELDAKVAQELERLSFNDRMASFEIITSLSLSTSNQKKLLITLRELAVRTGTTMAEYLATDQLQEIVNQQGNIPQISKQLFAWLQRQRFPRLSEAEDEFTHFCQQLPLPGGAVVGHSANFEEDKVSLTLTFATKEELAQFCQQLP